jgi:hypothetical protein
MRVFVDLQGASGASYRFRLWPDGKAHLPVAGNYIVVRETASNFTIIATDVSDDLSVVRQNLEPSLKDQPGVQIYTRLNVSRATRTTENEDILAADQTAPLAHAPKAQG